MIQEITISNFKSIREVTLSLNPINILIGPNGAGKSNFIGFFVFVYALYDQQLAVYTSKKGGADRILHLGRKKSHELTGELNFDDMNKYGFELTPTAQNNLFFKTEFDKFNKDKGGYAGGWSTQTYGVSHAESKLRNDDTTRGNYVKKYLQSFRVYHFHDTSSESPLRQTARIGDNRFLRAKGGNLSAFLLRLEQTKRPVFNRLQATIQQVAPYFERFDLVPDGDFVRLNWRQKGSDMYMDASDLSDGTLRFIALCTLLLQPDPPKTIIIDEPELGLHPYAITVLAGLMKSVSEKTQVIVATQSVSLIDNFLPEDIIVVTNENNESKFNRLDSNALADWLADYSLGELWHKNVLGGNP